ncbi:hypothetical protein IFM89_004328 [Coptis chinensis]|uniref:Calcineurin-like phosphoesterase domain-containing protein n=1 Tax=Coptis chinensis TaxID=261450 RepID=A0A835IAS6_9MAGN|nr:hypothetical protein IFM89_004328 [Coptis chinensis]
MQALTSCCGLAASTISPSHSSSLTNNNNNNQNRLCMASSVRTAIVGDVHDEWDFQEDSKALHFLQPDLVLFTGMFFFSTCHVSGCDFGNENVELVSSIAKLEITKAVILGNHDCWSTSQFSGKKKDRVQLQLESLGEEHVGYRRMDFPKLNLSIVGGRPFSHGGDKLFRERLLSARSVSCTKEMLSVPKKFL